MIPFKNRFHGHGGLRYLYRNGHVARSRFATLKYISAQNDKQPRFAVVVSKKIVKGAVKRNRIRRRVYGYIETKSKEIKPGSDVVIIITAPEVLTLHYGEIKSAIDELFHESKLYKSS